MTSHPHAGLRRRLDDLRASARSARRRHLALLTGAADSTRAAAASLLPPAPEIPWIGHPDVEHGLAADAAGALIGREFDALVFDAHQGLDVDTLGAASGCLRGGGILLLLAPPLPDWPAWRDPALTALLPWPLTEPPAPSPFLLRLARCLQADPDVLDLGAAAPRHPVGAEARPEEPPACDDPDCATPDQARAAANLLRVIRSRARRPLVISADRGRGKSAALGIAAARALLDGHGPLLITAPRRAAALVAMDHARTLLARAGRDDLRQALRFAAPDALIDDPPPARALLVDEAAALPAPLLAGLLDRYPRIAFTTTVHGYEGTGRSFDVRFRAILDARTPQWRALRMSEPIRFAADDPLERLLFRTLLLDAGAPDADAEAPIRIRRLDRAQLARDEALLRATFGLLVLAHYRTRPRDLRLLLDVPGVHVHLALQGEQPVGVCLGIDEGGLDASLARAITEGRRRPRGHLAAEVLAGQLGIAAGATLPQRRIARILTHPALRRRGLGRRLLEAAAEDARADGRCALTTSFGLTPDLLKFWTAAGFGVARVGLTRDARSAEHAGLLMRPLDDRGEALLQSGRAIAAGEFPDQLGDALHSLEPALIAPLLAALAPAGRGPDQDDLARVRRWLAGHCVLEEVIGSLKRTLQAGALDAGTADPAAGEWLLARVMQRRSWAEVAAALGEPGRADAEARLRRALSAGEPDVP